MAIPYALKWSANSNVVNCGQGASITSLTTFTMWAWMRVDSIAGNSMILNKGLLGSNSRHTFLVQTSRNVQCFVDRATTDTNFITNDTPITLGLPQFVAATFTDTGGAGTTCHIYVGDINRPAKESAYGTATTGAGAANSDSGDDLCIGNNTGLAIGFTNTAIWACGYHAAELSPQELRSIQQHPLTPGRGVQGLWALGANGTARVLDASGNGNHGTITGALLAADYLPGVNTPTPRPILMNPRFNLGA